MLSMKGDEMPLRDRADAVIDWLWRHCETNAIWFTVTAASIALALFGVGYGIVALIWR